MKKKKRILIVKVAAGSFFCIFSVNVVRIIIIASLGCSNAKCNKKNCMCVVGRIWTRFRNKFAKLKIIHIFILFCILFYFFYYNALTYSSFVCTQLQSKFYHLTVEVTVFFFLIHKAKEYLILLLLLYFISCVFWIKSVYKRKLSLK